MLSSRIKIVKSKNKLEHFYLFLFLFVPPNGATLMKGTSRHLIMKLAL